jgi:hypothetical protein
MNTKVLGIILIAFGILALVYQGFTYTHREKVLDIGPVQATAEKHETVPLPPIVGGVALATGIVLVLVGSKRTA